MKMMYNGTPIKSLNIRHYEMNTNSATMVASDLQSGITAYARGQKITGTGKSFAFATYGNFSSNEIIPIPVSEINTVSVSSESYAIKMTRTIASLRDNDFSVSQEVATVVIDNVNYPILLKVENSVVTFSCDKTINLQVVIGKDEYV